MTFKKAVIRFARFNPDDEGHGGMKRAAQIDELLVNNGYTIYDKWKNCRPKTKIKKLKYSLFGLILSFNNYKFRLSKKSVFEAQLVGYAYYSLKEQIETISKSNEVVSFFLWENTWPEFWYIPELVEKVGLQIIATPHNLESLVYSQCSFVNDKIKSPNWFFEELAYLKKCKNIFTISREEQWLLSIFCTDSKVSYLPYIPTKSILKELLIVREKRKALKNKSEILVLGSAGNEPTLEGLKQLKSYIQKLPDVDCNFSFVGYVMNRILDEDEKIQDNISVDQDLETEEFYKKLLNAKCILIYQIPTSGALTKIYEMLVAGIPIVVNNFGARSYFNMEGVTVYEEINELKKLLQMESTFKTPLVPNVEKELEENFLRVIMTN